MDLPALDRTAEVCSAFVSRGSRAPHVSNRCRCSALFAEALHQPFSSSQLMKHTTWVERRPQPKRQSLWSRAGAPLPDMELALPELTRSFFGMNQDDSGLHGDATSQGVGCPLPILPQGKATVAISSILVAASIRARRLPANGPSS